MNTYQNARLTVYGRALLVKRIVELGLRAEEAAQAAGVSTRMAYKWLARYREEGPAGLLNRSSRPHHCPHSISAERQRMIVERRKSRLKLTHFRGHLNLTDQGVPHGQDATAVPG